MSRALNVQSLSPAWCCWRCREWKVPNVHTRFGNERAKWLWMENLWRVLHSPFLVINGRSKETAGDDWLCNYQWNIQGRSTYSSLTWRFFHSWKVWKSHGPSQQIKWCQFLMGRHLKSIEKGQGCQRGTGDELLSKGHFLVSWFLLCESTLCPLIQLKLWVASMNRNHPKSDWRGKCCFAKTGKKRSFCAGWI